MTLDFALLDSGFQGATDPVQSFVDPGIPGDTGCDATEPHGTAVAEIVHFERQPRKFLGVFEASELVPVPIAQILRLDLAAQPAPFGSARWIIVNAHATEGVPIT